MFFKKGREFNNLAKGFNGLFMMINELEVSINNTSDYRELSETLLTIAYISRIDIIDRLEIYNWQMTTPISIPMMSKGRLTIVFAYQQTIGRLIHLSEITGYEETVNEILDKKDAFYQIESIIPNHIKNLLK